MGLPLLSCIILLPLIGSLVAAVVKWENGIKHWATGISVIQLLALIYAGTEFDHSATSFQWKEELQWIQLPLGSLGEFVIKYSLGVDGLSFLLIALTGFISFLAIINSHSIQEKKGAYFSLVLLLNAALMGCFLSRDLFLFYVFFEFMLLPMYFLIGIWGGPRKNYASIKFFLYTLIGSLFILIVMLGISLAYIDPYETAKHLGLIQEGQNFDLEALKNIQTAIANKEIANIDLVHSFDMQALSDVNNCQTTSILHPNSGWLLNGLSARMWGFWLLFIGFAIKLPMVPLHTWLPDAHVEAPTPISVLLAGVLLKIGAYGWLRTAIPFFPEEALESANIMAALGTISIIYGAYNALAMSDLKKLVAYSSVSHMGFVLLGISSFHAEGWQGAIYQLISHGILSSLLFLVVGVLYERTHDRQIDHYSGIATLMPRFTLISGIAIFASLGLPGFSGFIGEFFSLLGAFTSPYIHPAWAVLGAFGILLGAGYFLWTFQKVYLGKTLLFNSTWKLPDLNRLEIFSLFSLGILSILFGILPQLILDWSKYFVSNFLTTLPY
ncbi:NADH-quinone oxidoreductase subunit M [Cytophagaceae bacterium 50C-KIRBA]|uniref:NADH-quinone oxidoreductase subunit M n=1 Tax=Aquirufa beregesia TaxID=2516556 RepID=A0ABX0F036_9BACT|nr:NADH-quinone oxidoreductase subunit M [Aquirufa beregesia]NGZ44852.1 NADH-quinone oxidoreductase subunit M [Aquirufa beregesia]